MSSAGASDALRDQLKKEKIKLEEQVKKLEDELNAARAEIAQLKNKIRELEAENAALTKAKNAESEENKKLRERIKQLEDELAKRDAELRARKAAEDEERAKAERERLRLKEEYDEKMRAKAREYDRLKDEHDAAMNQLNSKARSAGMTQEELDKARDAELALKQDKRRAEDLLEAEKRDRRRDQQDAEAKLAAKDREIAALKDEVNRLKKQEDDNLERIKKYVGHTHTRTHTQWNVERREQSGKQERKRSVHISTESNCASRGKTDKEGRKEKVNSIVFSITSLLYSPNTSTQKEILQKSKERKGERETAREMKKDC